jgi:hypothetical protein
VGDSPPGSAKPAHPAASQAHSFTPLLSEFAGDHWRKGSEGIYTQAWANGDGPDEAGFKIRIFVHPAFADETLRRLLPIVVDEGCPFKVIANSALLELAFAKWPPENPAGAFLTVYPPSEAAFNDLTGKLQEAAREIKMSETPQPALEDSGRAPLTTDNPWPGLDFYLPEESAYFFGFADEQAELSKRIDRAPVTVVLGPARTGKSSLLRAGLATTFAAANLVPVYLRVKFTGAVHPVQQIRDEINRVLLERQIDGAPFGEGQTLRDYFYGQPQPWVDANKKLVAPVLVFDQFEDVFAVEGEMQASPKAVDAYWTQIANLIENRGRDSMRQIPLSYSEPRTERSLFKMVISLRQDQLPKLLGRRGQIPSIAQNQFVIKPFSGRRAVEAILGPGRHLLDPANADALAEEIVRRVARETGQSDAMEPLDDLPAEPALLSFFCQQLNEARSRRSSTAEAGAGLISARLLEAEAGRIFARYFHREEPVIEESERSEALPASEPERAIQEDSREPEASAIQEGASERAELPALAEPPATPAERVIERVVAAVQDQATERPETLGVSEPALANESRAPEAAVAPELPAKPVEVFAVVEPPAPVVEPVTEPEAPVVSVPAQVTLEAAPVAVPEIPEPKVLALPIQATEAEPPRPDDIHPGPPEPVHPAKPPEDGERKIRRLRFLMGVWGVLLVIILTILVVTRIEDLQREQTQAELEEYVSHLASTRNTFNSAHRELSIAEANLALKESNLLALTAQAREQQFEARAAQAQYSKMAGERTNFQARINDLADEKNKAETRVAQWSSLLNDLTNQIAALTRQKEDLEARNHRLSQTNETHAATNTPGAFSLTLTRPSVSHDADEKQAAAMESPAEKLAAPVIKDTEPTSSRTADILLIHGQCLYAENGATFQPLLLRQNVHQGAVIKTGKLSWCDLFIRRAGITIRLAPESAVKIARLSLGSQNGVPVVDTLLELPYGRIFTVVRALVPGSTLEISDGAGRSVIEGGGLGSYMITAPRPEFGERMSVIPLRIVSQGGSSVLAPNQEYNAKDGMTFSLGASTWETTLLHLDELEAEADKALAQPEAQKPSQGSSQ